MSHSNTLPSVILHSSALSHGLTSSPLPPGTSLHVPEVRKHPRSSDYFWCVQCCIGLMLGTLVSQGIGISFSFGGWLELATGETCMICGGQNEAAVIIFRKTSLQSLLGKNAQKPSSSHLVPTLLCSSSSPFLAMLAKWWASPAPDAWLRGSGAPLLSLLSATGYAQLPYKFYLVYVSL